MSIKQRSQEAIDLLSALIRTPSFSSEEDQTAALIDQWLKARGVRTKHFHNNVYAVNLHEDPSKPYVLLNSHHDTVRPNKAYTRDPFEATIEDGKLFGLGSNDAGGPLVSLLSTFVHFYERDDLPYNMVMAASAEEETAGPLSLSGLLPELPNIDLAIVGEPTLLDMAVAEKGLLVYDAVVRGTPSHAAHPNDDNAIMNTVEVLEWFKNVQFEKVSKTLGAVKTTVTQINAGKQHNVVPAQVDLVVDVRVTDAYTNEEIDAFFSANAPCEMKARSLRLRSSGIPLEHELVKAGQTMGMKTYGSPTLSDQAALTCPSIKLGPGDSLRSHSADEFIFVHEIDAAIDTYIELLDRFFNAIKNTKLMKLWEKGIATSKTVESFTVADDRTYDIALAPYDVQASMAHAKMLGAQGIITSEESEALVTALAAYGDEVSRDGFVIEEEYEDIHSKIEAHLIEKLGDTGKKIHTARSRNDQVLVALQLYSVDQLQNLATKTHAFAQVLLRLAEQNKEAFMPGYTHMQVAMPSSFGLWFSAYAETLADDIVGLKTAQHLANQNPLGSAAGYGSSFDIDRDAVTRELNFDTTKVNAIAAQMMRGRNERRVVGALGELAVTLSKLAGDICLYMGQDFGFFSFPDHITTGSSIMPHKKNPDVFELLRANANSFQASQIELSMILTNLSTGYHRDLQLTKPLLMDGFTKMNELLDVFIQVLPEIKVNDSLADLEKYDYLYSVDTLNQWVSDGMPFREAYRKMAEDIANGAYSPNKNVAHKHLGSKGNLGLDRIENKLDAALKTGRLS